MELSGPSILNSDQLSKCKKEQKTFRFQIELNDEEDYEVSYFDLFERHLGRHSLNGTTNGSSIPPKTSPGQEKGLAGIADDYVKQLDNYGPSVILKKGSKKRRLQVKDFCDMGYGYDLNDPFIDDTESYDAVVPPDVQAQEGGFYVNSGEVKTVIDNSSDIETWIVGGNVKPVAVDSSSDESQDSLKVQKPHFSTPGKPKKRSKQLVVKAVRQLSKPKPAGGPGTNAEEGAAPSAPVSETNGVVVAPGKVAKKRGPYKTAKKRPADDPAAAKASSPKKRAILVNFQSPPAKTPPTSAGDSDQKPAAASTAEKAGSEAVKVEAPTEPKSAAPLVVELSSGHSTPTKMTAAQLDKLDNIFDQVIKPTPSTELLPSVPDAVRVTVSRLKEEAKKTNFDLKQFFSATSDELLMRLDTQLRPCPASVRTNVFNHLTALIPGAKKSFNRRIKKLKEEFEDRKVMAVLEQLKLVISNLMPETMKRYETDLKIYQERLTTWKTAYEEYERQKNASNQSSGPPVIDLTDRSEESGELVVPPAAPNGETPAPSTPDLGPAPRRPNQPRRTLPVTDQMRTLVTRAVLLKLQAFDNLGLKNVTEEEYLKRFLENQLTPLWPKGWVTTAYLVKLSRTGVEKFRQWRLAVKQSSQKPNARAEPTNENGPSVPVAASPAQLPSCQGVAESPKKNASSILGAAQVVPNESDKASCVMTVGHKATSKTGASSRPVAKPVPASSRKISSLLKNSMAAPAVPKPSLPTQLRQEQQESARNSSVEGNSTSQDREDTPKVPGTQLQPRHTEAEKQQSGGAYQRKPSPKACNQPQTSPDITLQQLIENELASQRMQHQQQQPQVKSQQPQHHPLPQQFQQPQAKQPPQQSHPHQQSPQQPQTKQYQQQPPVSSPQLLAQQIRQYQEQAKSHPPGEQMRKHEEQIRKQQEQLYRQKQEAMRKQQEEEQVRRHLEQIKKHQEEQIRKQKEEQTRKQQEVLLRKAIEKQEEEMRKQKEEQTRKQQEVLLRQAIEKQQEEMRKQQEEQRKQQGEHIRKQQEEQMRKQQEEQIRKHQQELLRKQQEEQMRKQQELLRKQQEEQMRKQQELLRKQQEEQMRKQQQELLRKQQEEQMRKQQQELLRKQQEEQMRLQQEEQIRKQQEEQILQQQLLHQEQLRRQQQQEEEQLRQQREQENQRRQQLEQMRQQREEQIRQQQQEHLRRKQLEQEQLRQQEEQLRQQHLEQRYQHQLQQHLHQAQQAMQPAGSTRLPPASHLISGLDRPVGHVRGNPQPADSLGGRAEVHAGANAELTFGQLSEADAESYLQMKSRQLAAAGQKPLSPQQQPAISSPALPSFAATSAHLQRTTQASYSGETSWAGYPSMHTTSPNAVNSFALPHTMTQTVGSSHFPIFHNSTSGLHPNFPSSRNPPS